MSSEIARVLRSQGAAVCRAPSSAEPRWLVFANPLEIVEARSLDEVAGVVERAYETALKGRWAAGFVSYEAAPAFDSAMETKAPAPGFPLAWFSLYEKPLFEFAPELSEERAAKPHLSFKPEIPAEAHCAGIERVKGCIDRGETYQIDLSLRFFDRSPGEDAAGAFLRLAAAHPAPRMAFFNGGSFAVCSLSPESFLERRGREIATEPMKGTARRLPDPEADRRQALWLANDEKNRAENLMIVDMCRNDLGRICETGSVRVPELFKVSSYPTVHQMTSLVTGVLPERTSLLEILKASFPPASITGAPKIMAMKRIAELETSPRKLYTGCAGCVAPGGDFSFNVAIRTPLFTSAGAELGVGGGIVADSVPEDEWDECLAKASFVSHKAPDFKVLETILWRRDGGFQLLKEHLERAKESQLAFGRKWLDGAFERALESLKLEEKDLSFARVRVVIAPDGETEAAFLKIAAPNWGEKPLRALLATIRVDSANRLLRRKTTDRKLYDDAIKTARAEGFDETLFLNERDELAEGSISNVALRNSQGELLTPELSCGLLPGIWRSKLGAKETRISVAELRSAKELLVGNSVRGTGSLAELWRRGSSGELELLWRRPRP